MTYRAPFGFPTIQDGEAFEVEMVAPPIVRRLIEASPKWAQANSNDMAEFADAIIMQNMGTISAFVLSQRQNHNIGSMQCSSTEMTLPKLRIRYDRNFDQEIITLTVTPESTSGGEIIAQAADTFDISAPFSGWPILGYASLTQAYPTGGFYDGTAGQPLMVQTGSLGNYSIDPCFSDDNPNYTPPLGFPISPLEKPSGLWEIVQSVGEADDSTIYTEGSISTFQLPAQYYSTITNNAAGDEGIDSNFWTPNVGGSGICVTPISGTMYWEVSILALPDAVPPPKTLQSTFPADGYSETSPVFERDDNLGTWTWKWPEQVTTFLNPVIGLVPQSYVNSNWKANTQVYGPVIGLDASLQGPRSIGVTRSTVFSGTRMIKTWNAGNYTVDNAAYAQGPIVADDVVYLNGLPSGPASHWPVPVAPVPATPPTSVFLCDDNLFIHPNPFGASLDPDSVTLTFDTFNVGTGNPGTMISDGVWVYMAVDPGSLTYSEMVAKQLPIGGGLGNLNGYKTDLNALVEADFGLGSPKFYDISGYSYEQLLSGIVNVVAEGTDDQLAALQAQYPNAQVAGPYTDEVPPVYVLYDDYVYSQPIVGILTNGGDDTVGSSDFTSPRFMPIGRVGGALLPMQCQRFDSLFGSQLQFYYGVQSDHASNVYLITPNVGSEPFQFNPLKGGIITYNPGHYTQRMESHFYGEFFTAADQFTNPLQGKLNQPGQYGPVFKGRPDRLGNSIVGQPNAPQSATANGVWTGVDLGAFGVDDVIMIAADTGTRKVWFGVNGKWYDSNGVSDAVPNPANDDDLLPSTYMDGTDGSGDDEVLYYPACSFRLGPTKLRMVFGNAVRYTPPPGFAAYGALPDITTPVDGVNIGQASPVGLGSPGSPPGNGSDNTSSGGGGGP